MSTKKISDLQSLSESQTGDQIYVVRNENGVYQDYRVRVDQIDVSALQDQQGLISGRLQSPLSQNLTFAGETETITYRKLVSKTHRFSWNNGNLVISSIVQDESENIYIYGNAGEENGWRIQDLGFIAKYNSEFELQWIRRARINPYSASITVQGNKVVVSGYSNSNWSQPDGWIVYDADTGTETEVTSFHFPSNSWSSSSFHYTLTTAIADEEVFHAGKTSWTAGYIAGTNWSLGFNDSWGAKCFNLINVGDYIYATVNVEQLDEACLVKIHKDTGQLVWQKKFGSGYIYGAQLIEVGGGILVSTVDYVEGIAEVPEDYLTVLIMFDGDTGDMIWSRIHDEVSPGRWPTTPRPIKYNGNHIYLVHQTNTSDINGGGYGFYVSKFSTAGEHIRTVLINAPEAFYIDTVNDSRQILELTPDRVLVAVDFRGENDLRGTGLIIELDNNLDPVGNSGELGIAEATVNFVDAVYIPIVAGSILFESVQLDTQQVLPIPGVGSSVVLLPNRIETASDYSILNLAEVAYTSGHTLSFSQSGQVLINNQAGVPQGGAISQINNNNLQEWEFTSAVQRFWLRLSEINGEQE